MSNRGTLTYSWFGNRTHCSTITNCWWCTKLLFSPAFSYTFKWNRKQVPAVVCTNFGEGDTKVNSYLFMGQNWLWTGKIWKQNLFLNNIYIFLALLILEVTWVSDLVLNKDAFVLVSTISLWTHIGNIVEMPPWHVYNNTKIIYSRKWFTSNFFQSGDKNVSTVQPNFLIHLEVDITRNESQWNTMKIKSNRNSTWIGIIRILLSDSGDYIVGLSILF